MIKSKIKPREISKILFLIFFISLNISQISAQSDLVTSLPGIGVPKTTTYAEYITVNETVGANLFYLFWEAQNVTENTPIVLWLQGGPGCSSMFGSFVENGPYIIDSNGNFSENEFSWNLNAHTLYVDQPVGSGYSYVDQPDGYVTNERILGEELLRLLLGFFKLHPSYQSLDFFIFGESYAGKYVPTIASVILENNGNVGVGSDEYINLKAVGLGDGWVDPYLQASTYCVYLETEGLVTKEIVLQQLEDYKVYQNLSNSNHNIKANAYSYKMMMYCSFQGGVLDVYDIRYHLGDDPTNGPNDALTSYLNQEEVMEALHAGHEYLSCGRISHLFLAEDENRSEKSVVGELLTQKLPILLYNGDKDLTCNYLGTNLWSSQIGWSGQSAYNNSTKIDWYVNNQPAGYYKYASGLTHAIVYNAGHMVPFSQPENALSLLQNYLLHYNSTFTESGGDFNFL